MKQLFLFFIAAGLSFSVAAQSEKYQKAMETNLSVMDTVRSSQGWLDIANAFQRIADAEKTQWLPYYYAALGNVMHAYTLAEPGTPLNADQTDPLADKAEQLLNKAEETSKDNSEIFIVRKMIATLRMMADPMTRYQTYGPAAAEALAKAKQLNPDNPRVYLLEGQDKFFTPEQFGGSKSEAKTLFEESIKKFEAFKPESSMHPKWGLEQAKYFHEQSK